MGITTKSQTTAQRRRNGRAVSLSAVAVLALAWSSAVHATPFVEARATTGSSTPCTGVGCGSTDDIEIGLTGPQHATAFVVGNDNSSGTATADVGYGVMHLSSQFTNAGDAQAIGAIHDDLTFTAPGVAKGAQLKVTFSVLVEGAIEGTGGSGGEWTLQAGIGGGELPIFGSATDTSAHGYVGTPFGLFTATETIQEGISTPLDIELDAASLSDLGGAAAADLGDTLLWGGISSITSGGVALTDYSVIGASGTNWADSFIPVKGGVPEPATWAMMLVGFGGLGTVMRRHRRALVQA